MIRISINQPEQLLPRHKSLRCGGAMVWLGLMIIVLIRLTSTAVALAELPQRNRSLTYLPVTNTEVTNTEVTNTESPPTEQVQLASRNRTRNYEPVRRQSTAHATQQPSVLQSVDLRRYTVNRPTPDPQESSFSSATGSSRGYGSVGVEMLPLPPPGDPVNAEQRRFLAGFADRIQAAKTGDTVPSGNNTEENPSSGKDDGTPSATGTNTGPIFVERIFQDELEKQWYARVEGELTPIPLFKLDDKFYRKDANGNPQNQVFLHPDSTDGEQTQDNAKSAFADDQTRNAVLLIVTTVAVLAALGVGFLAFDYKHRWEQEVVVQNSRLLGTPNAPGTFGELDSLEPETLSFHSHDYRPLDDSFDHSFRTIA